MAALGTPAVASPGTARASMPLIPRNLPSLGSASHTLIAVDRARFADARPVLRRTGGTEVSRRFGVWRLSTGAARQVLPRLAKAGLVREFEADRPLSVTGSSVLGSSASL